MTKYDFIAFGGKFCFKKHGFTTQFHPQFIHELSIIPDTNTVDSKPTIDGYWGAIRAFLQFLAADKPPLYMALEYSSKTTNGWGKGRDWDVALMLFRDWVRLEKATVRSANRILSAMNWWLLKLASRGAIPWVDNLRLFEVAALANTNAPTIVDCDLPQHVIDALNTDESLNRDEISRIHAHVRYEVQQLDLIPDGFNDLSMHEKSQWVLSTRLKRIRQNLESKFLEARDIRCEGVRLVEEHEHLVSLIDDFLNFNGGKGSKNPARAEVLELGYETYRAALLSWFWHKNYQIQLKNHDGKIYRTASSILNKLREQDGLDKETYSWSDQWFADRLGCTWTLMAPSVLIIIFDNAMNSTSAYDIRADCLENEMGASKIAWLKKRAKNELFMYVPDNIAVSSIDVVNEVLDATQTYREMCLDEDKGFLFLSYSSSKSKKLERMYPRKPSWNAFTDNTKALLDVVGDSGYSGNAKMLRDSILLLEAMVGNVQAVEEKAQHQSSRVATGYADKSIKKLKNHEKMREFKEWLQTLITIDIEDAPSKLGVDEAEYERRKQNILNSRFGGLFCKNPTEGVQPGTTKGEYCNKIANCLLCKNKRNIFIESVENITHLLQWEESLHIALKEGLIDPDKFPNWYFWLAYINEMLTRLRANDLNKVRNEALIADAKSNMSKRQNPYLAIDFKEVS